MRSSLATRAIETCVKADRPAFIWGQPGIGKTAVVKTVGKKLALPVKTLVASNFERVDLSGVPYLADVAGNILGAKETKWATPAELPKDGEGILFLDELNAAPRECSPIYYRLIQERKLGDYTLPEGWKVVAAGNRDSDKAVTYKLSSALGSRVTHLDFEAHIDDWCKDFAYPTGVSPELIAFLRFQRKLFNAFDPSKRTFACPRTWADLDQIYKAKPDGDIELDLYAGTVDIGPATEWVGFLQTVRANVTPDAILLNPGTAAIPDKSHVLTAVCWSLALAATDVNFSAIIQYADRLEPEYGVTVVREIVRQKPDLQHTDAFTRWSALNADAIS